MRMRSPTGSPSEQSPLLDETSHEIRRGGTKVRAEGSSGLA
jgi:hypothetical protein